MLVELAAVEEADPEIVAVPPAPPSTITEFVVELEVEFPVTDAMIDPFEVCIGISADEDKVMVEE